MNMNGCLVGMIRRIFEANQSYCEWNGSLWSS